MALPVFQALGATQEDATLGSITVPWPASHAVNDVALLVVECTGGQAASLTTANGFVEVANSPQNTGTTTAGTRIHTYWCRATSTSMASPVVAVGGNHGFGYIITFRNVLTTGSPINITAGAVKAVASTSASAPTATTTVANCLVVNIISRDDDSAVAEFSAWTNASLASITEIADAGTNLGNGGGIGVAAGIKVAAGATGTTTATVVSSINASLTVALAPSANLGFGQAQVDIKAVGQGFGQAQADIKATGKGFGQSQATITPLIVPTLENTVLATSGAIGLYLFEETDKAYDQTGNNDGNYVGALTRGTALNIGEWVALSAFTGNSKYIQVKTSNVLSALPNATIIISMMGGAGDKAMYVERGSTGNDIWKVDIDTNRLRLVHRDDAGTLNFLPATTNIISGTPHIVSITKTGTAVAFFVDGATDGTGTITGNDTFTNATLEAWIGADKGDATVAWTGSIGFVALFNRALSQSEIQTIVTSATINKHTTEGSGQAQVDIKAMSNQFGQAQADIKATSLGFGQSQVDIKAVNNGFGQAQADIKSASKGFGQAQANIKVIGRGFGQALADIKSTYQWSTISKDTFTDISTTLLTVHVPDIGPMWTGADSRWSIGTNNLAVNILGSVGNTARLSLGHSDVVITCDIIKDVGTPNGGILFRYSDASNYWKVTFDNITTWNLTKVVAGTPTVVATTSSTISGHTEVYLKGNTISVALPNGPILATSDSFNSTATIHGIIEEDGSNANEFDNWNVYVPTLNTAQAQASIKAVGVGFAQAQADVKTVGQGFGQAQTIVSAFVTCGTTSGTTVKTITLNNLQDNDTIWVTAYFPNTSGVAISYDSASAISPISFVPTSSTAIQRANIFRVSAGITSVVITFTPTNADGFVASANVYRVNNGQVWSLKGGFTQTATGTNPDIGPLILSNLGRQLTLASVGEETGTLATSGSLWTSTCGVSDGVRSLANEWQISYAIPDPNFINPVSAEWLELVVIFNYATITNNYGQAQAYIKGVPLGFGQAQADIKVVNNGFGQSQVDIKATNRGFGQAQADIKVTSQGFGQAQSDIKSVSNNFAQTQADIKATSRGFAQSQADIKATSLGFGQAQADIKSVGIGVAQAQADIKSTGQGFSQAQADIKAIGRGFAQAQVDVKAIGQGFGQAQSDIKATSNKFAQAQADIKVTSQGYAQAQADIKVVSYGFGQAQADIKSTSNAYAQAQADIKSVSYGFGQSQADVKATGQGYSQAQADILVSTQQYGQAQSLVVTTVNVYGQSQTDIKAVGYGFAQAQTYINVSVPYGFGQAQCYIQGQHFEFAQAQAGIKATSQGYAQTQADIKTKSYGFAQAQADIKSKSNAFGQAQTDVLVTTTAYGQANAQIVITVFGFGQAQSDIKAVSRGYANAQASVKSVYAGSGQAQASIGAFGYSFGQAQAYIKLIQQGYAQAQACIRGNAFAQAQAYIYRTNSVSGNAQADIKVTVISNGQANALIRVSFTGFGQAQTNIVAVSQQFGQANALIIRHEGYGQAQAYILQPHRLKNLTVSDSHSTRVILSDTESTGVTPTDHYPIKVTMSDCHSTRVYLSDTTTNLLTLSDVEYD